MDDTLIGARAEHPTQNVEDAICDYIQNDITAFFAKRWQENQENPACYEPALFGVDKDHIKRFHDAYVHSKEDEIRQIDILQEECAELIQALSKMKRSFTNPDNSRHNSKKYCESRRHLIEELSHVAISSAVVSIQFFISQGDINLEVQRKDELFDKED